MVFAGKADACAHATLMSIGALGVEENKRHAEILSEVIERVLGVSKDRWVYIVPPYVTTIGTYASSHFIKDGIPA